MAPHLRKACINVDMGEAYGNFVCGPDEELIKLIDHANIACGFQCVLRTVQVQCGGCRMWHELTSKSAGDPVTMQKTIRLCKDHGVRIGAHPGLPDVQGFGRRMMTLSLEEHTANVVYQVGALQGFLAREDVALHHVKPHGALYGMMVQDLSIARAVWAGVPKGVAVFGLAGTHMETAALEAGLEFWAEYYADVKYRVDGTLIVDRKKQPWDLEDVKVHVRQQLEKSTVTAVTGEVIHLKVRDYPTSICCHSDSPGCVGIVSTTRAIVDEYNERFV